MLSKMEKSKKLAGEASLEFIKDGMTIGLGSGSTVNWMLKGLEQKVREGLDIKGIPTSLKTERMAKRFGIPLIDFSSVNKIDFAIDGADEIDLHFNLIKGGGGSLVREKLIDIEATEFIVIADESKLVSHLGTFSLPVEVLPFGWQQTLARISRLGGNPKRRMKDTEVFISDNGNYIFDCDFGKIEDPKKIHEQLKLLVGVVETGLFVEMVSKVIVGRNNHVEILEVKK